MYFPDFKSPSFPPSIRQPCGPCRPWWSLFWGWWTRSGSIIYGGLRTESRIQFWWFSGHMEYKKKSTHTWLAGLGVIRKSALWGALARLSCHFTSCLFRAMLRIGSCGITSDDPPCRRDLAELLALNSEYYTTREVQDQVLHTGEQIASSDRSDMLGNRMPMPGHPSHYPR